MDTESCIATEGLQFIAKDDVAKVFLNRLDCIPVCDISARIRKAHLALKEYCEFEVPEDEEESSSSSSCCPIYKSPATSPNVYHLVRASDLDAEVYALLTTLESEACEAIKELKALEVKIADPCNEPSSSSSLTPSSSSSSEGCCDGPEILIFDGPVSGEFILGNETTFNPSYFDQCNQYSRSTDDEYNFYIYAFNLVENRWELYGFNLSAPFTGELIVFDITGRTKCEFVGELGEITITIPASSSSSGETSDSSGSSGEGAPCYAFEININSQCEDFFELDAFTLEPSENTDPLYGECMYGLPTSSSSSSSGEPFVLNVRYNIGGYWEVYTSGIGEVLEGVVAIRITDNETDPRGAYQYIMGACGGLNLVIE